MSGLKTSSEYYARVASIEADLTGIARALEAVEERRKEAGLRFAEGEEVDFSEIDAEEARLTAQRKNLIAAQDQAKLLFEKAREAEKEQSARQKIVRYAELRAQILDVTPKVDKAASELVAAMHERAALIKELASVNQEAEERMRSNSDNSLVEALAAAGLGEFLHHVSSRKGQRLADIDVGMMGFSTAQRAVLDEEAAKKGAAQ